MSKSGGGNNTPTTPTGNGDNDGNVKLSIDEIRNIYEGWCHKYKRSYDSKRFQIFADNYNNYVQYAKKANQKVILNRYADLTPEEYKEKQSKMAEQQQRQQHSIRAQEMASPVPGKRNTVGGNRNLPSGASMQWRGSVMNMRGQPQQQQQQQPQRQNQNNGNNNPTTTNDESDDGINTNAGVASVEDMEFTQNLKKAPEQPRNPTSPFSSLANSSRERETRKNEHEPRNVLLVPPPPPLTDDSDADDDFNDRSIGYKNAGKTKKKDPEEDDTNVVMAGKERNFGLPDPKPGQINFLDDYIGHQTFSRRLATYLSKKYDWYNPQLLDREKNNDDDNDSSSSSSSTNPKNAPSLAKAWAFFEHVTLERYIVPEHHRHKPRSVYAKGTLVTGHRKLVNKLLQGDRKLEIAEPGECEVPTKLYSPIHTPLSQLGDFGLGYGLYFATIRDFAILAFCAGIINIPSLIYYSSSDYDSNEQEGVASLLKGSAICTDRSWVPCPTCTSDQFESVGAYQVQRFADTDAIVANNTAGAELLNVTTYIGYDRALDEYIYTAESLDMLYDDYLIRIDQPNLLISFLKEAETDDQTAGFYGTLGCSEDCIKEHTVADFNGYEHVYLNMTGLGSENIPPYGDASLSTFRFALKTNCNGATRYQGFLNLATVFFFILGVFYIRHRQSKIETKFDEDEQTAQDYSINILNPPRDAHDPDEWKEYFESCFDNCHVTVVTVDLDNDHILSLFIERRELLRQLELATPEGTPLDINSLERAAREAESKKQGCIEKLISPSIPKLLNRLKEVTAEIKSILKRRPDMPVTNVFVTFETEKAQRQVLSKLSVGGIAAAVNDTTVLPHAKYLFRGTLVLEVDEPEEPSSIRWQELNITKFKFVCLLIATSVATGILLLIGILIIMFLYAIGLSVLASLATTGITIAFPEIAKMLTNMEVHRSETSRQKFMFIKIVIFNVALTTILLSLVTPFIATLDDKSDSGPGLIPAVYALFYSQVFLSPLIQLSDPVGHLYRHILAPRAKSQDEMNMYMKGSEIFLAERYANLIKFIFLVVWYCAIYPAAFFMGSFALFVVYFVDRFSLMRTWARTPQVGSQIADFARNYITPTALVFMAVVSAYFWSGFPYDNLCEEEDGVPLDPNYVREWSIFKEFDDPDIFGITVGSQPDLNASFTIDPDTQLFKFCNQDLRFTPGRSFPPLPKLQIPGSEWMSEEQEEVLKVFGWSVVGILAAILLVFSYKLTLVVVSLFRSMYEPVGKDMRKNYSKVRSIDSYVPQKQSPFFPYPLLLCDLDDIDPSLFSWSDPDRPHLFYSVYEDMKEMIEFRKNERIPYIFSDVKHWPPK